MFKSLSIIFVAFFVQVVLSQDPIFEGTCPEVKAVDSFNLTSYLGVWYGNTKYPLPLVMNRRCIYVNYTYVNDEEIIVDGYGIDLTTGLETSNHWFIDVIGPGAFAIYYNEAQTQGVTNFLLLGTDYTNWVVAYNCRNVDGNKHTLEVWTMSRTRVLAPEYKAQVDEVLKASNIDLSYFEPYDQKDCPAVE